MIHIIKFLIIVFFAGTINAAKADTQAPVYTAEEAAAQKNLTAAKRALEDAAKKEAEIIARQSTSAIPNSIFDPSSPVTTPSPAEEAQKKIELENARNAVIEAEKKTAAAQKEVDNIRASQGVKKPPSPGNQRNPEEAINQCMKVKFFECAFPDLTDTCIPCDVMKRMVEVSEQLGEKVYNKLRSSIQALIGMTLALAILIHAAKLLFPFSPLEKTQGILSAIITRTGLSVLVALALASFANYWQYIHTPVLMGSINLTGAVMEQVQQGAIAQKALNAIDKSSFPPDWTNPANTVLKAKICKQKPATVPEGIDCVVRQMQFGIGEGMGAGLNILMNGIPSVGLWNIMAIFTMIACATVLMIVYGIAFFAFPMKIADVVIRWTLFSVLSPLILAALIYPATRSFFVKAIRGLFQASMEMVMIGVVIALSGFAIFALGDWKTGMMDDGATGQVVVMNSIVFWQLVLVGITMNLMISKAKSFASELTGAAFDTNVAGEMADKMTESAGKLADAAGGGIENMMKSRGLLKG